jgi:hypothetical protein
MPRTGRPQTLDESKKKTIIAILSVGCTRAAAASYVNCNPKTISNTAKRDPYFAEQLTHVELAVEAAHLANILKAAKEKRHWRASAWALERIFPEKYGLKRG